MGERVIAVTWTTNWEIAAGFAHGHRSIAVSAPVIASVALCQSGPTQLSTEVTDAHWICALTVASFEPRMRCQCCRQRRAAVMPNWNERRAPNAASYFIPGRA